MTDTVPLYQVRTPIANDHLLPGCLRCNLVAPVKKGLRLISVNLDPDRAQRLASEYGGNVRETTTTIQL